MKTSAALLMFVGMTLGAANAPAQTPAKKSGPAAKAADRSFAPVHWDPALPPTAYARNDPKQVFAWVKRKIDAVGKIDEFSSSADREAHAAAVAAAMSAVAPIAFLTKCEAEYDAERQAFMVKQKTAAFRDSLLKQPNAEALTMRKLVLRSDVIESSKSATQNAYGARSMVTYTESSELALGVPAGAMNEPAAAVVRGNYTATVMPYAYEFIHYTTAVPMPAAEARVKKSPFGCIAVASLEAPYLFSYEERESTTRIAPSLDRINGTGLLSKLDRVQVYDKASGKIYATHERDGL
ncbi:hypothetical protein [Massilia pseudoviolaceinigra]|uniref:hypothetical protein n=1 Tax=Massilia pseudoviolaceinigra TaxID=3057165 RepID=UPI002796AD55|nr:hypothetical protein [Massilia sp. CCM 9206]MDQ1921548.1 hypothetical protein [Massilia sp. CCM 9206]